jgi:hypothetical protein
MANHTSLAARALVAYAYGVFRHFDGCILKKPGKLLVANGKNRPAWRIAMGHGPKDATFKGHRSRFGDGHPNRRQCVAKAKSTGQRCRCDALRFASCCRLHGGHQLAYRAIGSTVSKAALRKPRVALAAIGSGPMPEGLPVALSPVDRGKLIEAWRNRATSPDEVNLAITATTRWR